MNIHVHRECHEPTADVGGKLQEDSPPQTHPNQGNSFPSPICLCKLSGDSGDNALYIEGNSEVNWKNKPAALQSSSGWVTRSTIMAHQHPCAGPLPQPIMMQPFWRQGLPRNFCMTGHDAVVVVECELVFRGDINSPLGCRLHYSLLPSHLFYAFIPPAWLPASGHTDIHSFASFPSPDRHLSHHHTSL